MHLLRRSDLVLLALLATLASSAAPAQRAVPLRPYPEGVAAIERVLLHFDPDTAEDWLPACRDILRALPPEVLVTIAVHGDAEADQLDAMLADQRSSRLELLTVGVPVTPWARDRLLVVGDGAQIRTLLPEPDSVGESYVGDLDAAVALAYRQGWRSAVAGLAFEGGDIVCGRDLAFVGWNTIVANAPAGARDEIVLGFEHLLGTRVVVLGEPEQPHDHLDMILTVLDGNTVVLGDPEWGHELLRELETRFEQAALPDFDEWTAAAQRDVGAGYAAIRAELRRQGIDVLRIPILHGEEGGVLTWNNCLVERRAEGRRVYMPSYGIPALDDVAARVFEEAGCRVFPISAARIAANGGTVRCITNVVSWSAPRRRAAARPAMLPTGH